MLDSLDVPDEPAMKEERQLRELPSFPGLGKKGRGSHTGYQFDARV
jgi:hypothetical protein